MTYIPKPKPIIKELEEEARERRQRIVEHNSNSALHYETNTTEITTPKHYDNTNGTLYKIAEQRGWNAYQFDSIKRIDRVNKKGQFKEDIEKTIAVLKLMLNNQ
jgi:uncharacterized protein YkuJ